MLPVPKSSLVLLYDKKRIYPGTSPELLKIWKAADIIACSSRTLPQLQQRVQASNPPSPPSSQLRRSPSQLSDADDQTDKLKLTIRSTTHEYTFRVTSSTTCGELVAKFVYKAGNSVPSGTKKPTLLFDGDKLSETTTLADLDIDTGDMLEIINV